MQELSDKVAVVTGAASGIGLALSRAFADQGMKVVMADIEAHTLKEAAASLPSSAEVLTVDCDVSDADQVDALRDATVERFGTAHVVCNNAGVSAGGPAWSHSPKDWEWVLGVNLYGVINGVRSFTPLLIEQGEGHIVNTASMAGVTSPPFMAAYNVSKHGVVALSETLFGDLQMVGAAGVGVSVLCPGWVQTRIHEADRNRPDSNTGGGEAAFSDPGIRDYVAGLINSGIAPAEVADLVVDAIVNRRFYVLTHPDWKPMISNRVNSIVEQTDPVAMGLPT